MKTAYLTLVGLVILANSIHSQSKTPETSAAGLIQIKSANAALIDKQTQTLKTLEAMEAEAQQLRIVSKRG